MAKEKGWPLIWKYIELCTRQIAKIAKDDKIVVENLLPARTAEAIAFWIAQEMEFNSRSFQSRILAEGRRCRIC
jgi:hypothetical protein